MREAFSKAGLCVLLLWGAAWGDLVESWEELIRRSEELFDAGRFGEAEPLLLRAVRATELFPPTDIRRAETQRHMGRVYKELGRLQEAEKWYERSLVSWKESVGDRDASLAKPLIGLVTLYLESGLTNKAERLLEPWLRDGLLFENAADPVVVSLLHVLAGLHFNQRRFAKAEVLFLKAMAGAAAVFGPQSDQVALLFNNLAMLFVATKRSKEAGVYLERALRIWESNRVPDHPDVARALTNLAAFYRWTGEYGKAEPLFQRALAIAENRLGPEARLVEKILSEYAVLLRKTKRKDEAKVLETRAKALRESHGIEDLGRHTVDFRDLGSGGGDRRQ